MISSMYQNSDYFPADKSNHVIAVLLPGYSPDLAWMARALRADHVILDDHHPFSRKSKVHRTKIRTPDGYQWLTLPFVSEDRRKPINRVRINHRRAWLKHHLQALEYNYRNSLYFDYYEPEIRSDLETAADCEYLIDAVRHLMKRQWAYLQLPSFPKIISNYLPASDKHSREYSAEHSEEHSREYSAEQSGKHSGNTPGGVQTNDLRRVANLPASANITIWQEPHSRHYQKPFPGAAHPSFTHPVYRQHFPGFVAECGALDLLFEYGPDCWQILDQITFEK